MDKKVSIYDIASHLNISAATVSYVINGVPKVGEKTKKRVLDAIEELGYIPNYTARALSTGKSELIGIVLPLADAAIGFVQNPFYSEFIAGFETGLKDSGYDVLIATMKNVEEFKIWANSRDLAGIVVIGSLSNDLLDELNKTNMPVVLVDNYTENEYKFNNVKSDDFKGAIIATNYLIGEGHKRIGFVGNPDKYLVDGIRFKGFKSVLEEKGLAFSDNHLFLADATYQDGYDVAPLIFSNKEITAIFCAGDMLAIGILKRALELNIKVPDDISIIGYDDIFNSSLTFPSLTTVCQNISEKGIKAASIVVDAINSGEKGEAVINLSPKLVIRNSVKKI